MKVITVRNVDEALPLGIEYLKVKGIKRASRNGPVLVSPVPVATVYRKPWERVIFWPERDANPFFHLYESLWMLSGRNDLEPLLRYVTTFKDFSDDKKTIHDAYGYRWKTAFGVDQLEVIIDRLVSNPIDRRCVLQMWDAAFDLGGSGKAYPCNLTATFQINDLGKLDMVVFNRSNDIIWGAYGANAVHFSMLQDYMAARIGCPIGIYTQISVNYHAYIDTLNLMKDLKVEWTPISPYEKLMSVSFRAGPNIDKDIKWVMAQEPFEKIKWNEIPSHWAGIMMIMFHAHWIWKNKAAPERYSNALNLLETQNNNIDWIRAGKEWIKRRQTAWQRKMDKQIIQNAKEHETLGEA